jgi:hypothetical protein
MESNRTDYASLVIYTHPKFGYYHNINGPAIVWKNGSKQWFYYGLEYSEQEFNNIPDVIAYNRSNRLKSILG